MKTTRIQELRNQIDGISDELKRPMPHLHRQLLVADRKDMRAALAALEADELSDEARGIEAK